MGKIISLGSEKGGVAKTTSTYNLAYCLAKEGKKITGRTMELFLGKTGDDMENIRMELEKLVGYTLGRDVITEKDVEAVCTVRVTSRIFEMIAAISGGQTRKAMDLYEDLLTLKEPPMRILYLINRQFRILLDLKSMYKKGLDAKTMAAKASIPPFAVKRSLEQAAAFSEKELRQALNEGAELETDCKTGRMTDQIAVEMLIVTYSRRDA